MSLLLLLLFLFLSCHYYITAAAAAVVVVVATVMIVVIEIDFVCHCQCLTRDFFGAACAALIIASLLWKTPVPAAALDKAPWQRPPSARGGKMRLPFDATLKAQCPGPGMLALPRRN